MAIGYVTGVTLFRAKSYSELLTVSDGNFEKILKTSAMTKCRGLTPTVHTHLPTSS